MYSDKKKEVLMKKIWDKITSIDSNTQFTIRSLFSKDELFSITEYQLIYMTREFRYQIRTMPEMTRITEVNADTFAKTPPKFSRKEYNFDSSASVQELFHHVCKIIKNHMSNEEPFLLKDLFPGYVWNRLSLKQKQALGRIADDYSYRERKLYALVGTTKQKQHIYRALYERKKRCHKNWEDVYLVRVSITRIKDHWFFHWDKYETEEKVMTLGEAKKLNRNLTNGERLVIHSCS